MAKAAIAAILLASAGLTAWTWTLPHFLPVAQDWGERQANAYAEALFRLQAQRKGASAEREETQTTPDLEAWKDRNSVRLERVAKKAEQLYRDQYTYQVPDEGEHTYLGGTDSYHWLHIARKLIRSGRLCEPVEGGRCIDAFGHAPVGAPQAYPYSLHVFAIVAIHRLVTTFRPHYPLAASSKLLAVTVAVLGVVPAFFVGRLLAGTLGGLIAAVMITLHPLVLVRSLRGDNDVWNFVLPLFMVWAAAEALSGARWRRTIYAVLAGAVAGLHATIWQGWIFAYVVVTVGIFGYLAIQTVTAIGDTRSWRVWHREGVLAAAQTLLVFYVATGFFVTLAGDGNDYLMLPLKALEEFTGALFDTGSRPATSALAWPDVLGTVSELQRLDLSLIAVKLGGKVFMLIGLVGLLLAFYPRQRWRARHYGLLFVGVGLYVFVLFFNPLDGRIEMVLIVAAPPMSAVILTILERRRPDATDGLAVIVLMWFLAALYLSYNGPRYVFLLAPPFSLAVATGVGCFFEWLRTLSEAWLGRFRRIADSAAFLLLATILLVPVSKGVATARGYYPKINDAWFDSLTALREQSDPRSIVTIWWDYGHWAKYLTDRRVTADGSSLLTHLPYWIAKALTTSDPRESFGILRMLNCASDATPLPEGAHGAYGKVKATGRDDLEAYSIVAGLTVRNRAQAETYLTERRFSAPERQEILAASHCNLPESYLLLNTTLLELAHRLFEVGHRDPRRIELARLLGDLAGTEAVDWLAAEFGYTRVEAQSLYRKVEALTGRPGPEYLDTAWRLCRPAGEDRTMECPFSINSKAGQMRGLFRYRRGHWSKAYFKFNSAAQNATNVRDGSPGLILLAGDDRLSRIVPDDPVYSKKAVLLDLAKQRILIGTPAALRSTLVQLVVLDGRYTKLFEKLDERAANLGERVSTWRINWAEVKEKMP
jgi:asparagine N-glycosylation enzyme membrane subunit Stt3